MIQSFRDLEVWRRSHELVLMVYRATERFPDRERFGIISQSRRAAASIPANIAEGYGRRTTGELLQSLAIANGSLEECRYFMILSKDLGYLSSEDYQALEQQDVIVGRLLGALTKSLKLRALRGKSQSTEHRSQNTESGRPRG